MMMGAAIRFESYVTPSEAVVTIRAASPPLQDCSLFVLMRALSINPLFRRFAQSTLDLLSSLRSTSILTIPLSTRKWSWLSITKNDDSCARPCCASPISLGQRDPSAASKVLASCLLVVFVQGRLAGDHRKHGPTKRATVASAEL